MYLFFVRRYNDIDHIVPIIYRMAKDGVKDIKIFCTNLRLDLKRDFRILFLEKKFNIISEYYFLSKTVGFTHFLLVILAKVSLFYIYPIRSNSRFSKYFLGLFYSEKILKKYCIECPCCH